MEKNKTLKEGRFIRGGVNTSAQTDRPEPPEPQEPSKKTSKN